MGVWRGGGGCLKFNEKVRRWESCGEGLQL